MSGEKKCKAKFRDEAAKACLLSLEKKGFTRHSKGWVDFPFNDEFFRWVGLNTGLNADFARFNPFIGIHAPKINKLCAKLESRSYSRSVATYARHIAQINPDVREIKFRVDEDVEKEADYLASAVSDAIATFSRSIASYEELCPLLKGRLHWLGGFPERYACCLHLLGKNREAIDFVQKFSGENPVCFDGQPEAYASYFKSPLN